MEAEREKKEVLQMWKSFLSSKTFPPDTVQGEKSVGNSNLKYKIGVHYSTQLHTQYKHLRSIGVGEFHILREKVSPNNQMFSCRNVIYLTCFSIISYKIPGSTIASASECPQSSQKGRRQWQKPWKVFFSLKFALKKYLNSSPLAFKVVLCKQRRNYWTNSVKVQLETKTSTLRAFVLTYFAL